MRSPLKVCLLLAFVVSVAFCGWGCTETWVGPVAPVNPVPPQPTPITPIPPAPPTPPVVVDPSAVVPLATIQAAFVPGRAKAEVYAVIGVAPALESAQDDRTTTARWATTNKDGEPRWAVVTFDHAGKVIGHVLLPREA